MRVAIGFIVSILGVFVLALLNTAGLLLIVSTHHVPISRFGEGLTRSCIVTFFSLSALTLLFFDARSLYKSYRNSLSSASSSFTSSPASSSTEFPGKNGSQDSSLASHVTPTIHQQPLFKGPPTDHMDHQDVLLTAMLCFLIIGIQVVAAVFMRIEGWNFRDAEQWYLASISTLGFAIVSVKTVPGRILLLFVNTLGIIMVGLILTATATKLITMIRSFLLRGIRNMRRRAAERKRRVLQRRAVQAARREEALRVAREMAALRELDRERREREEEGVFGGSRFGNSVTWHGSTEAGKALAEAGRKLGGGLKGSSADTVAENGSKKDLHGESGEEHRSSVVTVSGATGLAKFGLKELVRPRSESALDSLFGVNVRGSRTETVTSTTAPAENTTRIPLGDSERGSVTSQHTMTPTPPRKLAEIHHNPLLISTSSSDIPAFQSHNTIHNPNTLPTPRISTASHAHHPQSLTHRINLDLPIPFPGNPHNTRTFSSPMLHPQQNYHHQQYHPSHRPGSSISDLNFDLGLPLVRTETVDSTTEAAYELGYEIGTDDEREDAHDEEDGNLSDGGGGGGGGGGRRRKGKDVGGRSGDVDVDESGVGGGGKEGRRIGGGSSTDRWSWLRIFEGMSRSGSGVVKGRRGSSLNAGGSMEDGMRGRPSTARTASGSQNVGIATGQSGSSKNVYRASSVGLPSDFEFASGEDGLTDTDDGGGFYTSADEDDDGDRILVVPTLPPVGVIGNDVLHTQRQQVVKEDFDTLDVPRKEAQPTVRSESVTINVPPSILDYRTSVYSGARSSITTADTSVKRRKKKWSLSKPLQKIHEWMDLHADTVSVAFLISLTFFGGSALFYICESDQWNYLDALYFMYSLMSTTGYGDVYPVSGWGRTLVVIMVFVGLGLWAYAVSAIVARLQAGRVGMMANKIHAEPFFCPKSKPGMEPSTESNRFPALAVESTARESDFENMFQETQRNSVLDLQSLEDLNRVFSEALSGNHVAPMKAVFAHAKHLRESLSSDASKDVRMALDAAIVEFNAILESQTQLNITDKSVLDLEALPLDDEDENETTIHVESTTVNKEQLTITSAFDLLDIPDGNIAFDEEDDDAKEQEIIQDALDILGAADEAFAFDEDEDAQEMAEDLCEKQKEISDVLDILGAAEGAITFEEEDEDDDQDIVISTTTATGTTTTVHAHSHLHHHHSTLSRADHQDQEIARLSKEIDKLKREKQMIIDASVNMSLRGFIAEEFDEDDFENDGGDQDEDDDGYEEDEEVDEDDIDDFEEGEALGGVEETRGRTGMRVERESLTGGKISAKERDELHAQWLDDHNVHDAAASLKNIGTEIGEIQLQFGAALSSNDPAAIQSVIERCHSFKESCSALFANLSAKITNSDFNDASAQLMENINMTLAAFEDITGARKRSSMSYGDDQEEQEDQEADNVVNNDRATENDETDSACDGIILQQTTTSTHSLNRTSGTSSTTVQHIMMSPGDLMKTLSRADEAFGMTDGSQDDDTYTVVPPPQPMSDHQKALVEQLELLKAKSVQDQKTRQAKMDAYQVQQDKLVALREQLKGLKEVAVSGGGGSGGAQSEGAAVERVRRLREMQEVFRTLTAAGDDDITQQQQPKGKEVVSETAESREGIVDEKQRAEYADKMRALARYRDELQGQENEITVLRDQLSELRQAKALLDEKKRLLAQVLEARGVQAGDEDDGGKQQDEKRASTLRPDYVRLFDMLSNSSAVIDDVEELGEEVKNNGDPELSALEERLDVLRESQEAMRSEANGRRGVVTASSSSKSVKFRSDVEQIQRHMSLDDVEEWEEEQEERGKNRGGSTGGGEEEGKDQIDLSVEQLLAKLLENSVREHQARKLATTDATRQSSKQQSKPKQPQRSSDVDLSLLVSAFESQTGTALSTEEREYLQQSLSQRDSKLNESMRDIWDGKMTGYEDVEVETFGDPCCTEGEPCEESYKFPTKDGKRHSGRYGCDSETASAEMTPAQMSPVRERMEVDVEDDIEVAAGSAAGFDDVDEAQIEDASRKIEDGISQILIHISELKKTDVDFNKPEHVRAYSDLFGSLSGQLQQFMEARSTIHQFRSVLAKQKSLKAGLEAKSVPEVINAPANAPPSVEQELPNFMKRPAPLQAERVVAPTTISSIDSAPSTRRETDVNNKQPSRKVSDNFDSIDEMVYARRARREQEENNIRQEQDMEEDDFDREEEPQNEEDDDVDEERTLDAKGVYRLHEYRGRRREDGGMYSWVEAAKVDEMEVEELKRANEIVQARLKASAAAEAVAQSTVRKIEQCGTAEGQNQHVLDGYSKRLYNQVKDSIYRGAANTISKYENEPFFLVNTFKGLQKLDSPYLRQKFLLLLDSVLEERDQINSETGDFSTTPNRESSTAQEFEDDDDEEGNEYEEEINSAVESPRRDYYTRSESESPVRVSRAFDDLDLSPSKASVAESDVDSSYGARIAKCISALINDSPPSSKFTDSQISNLQNFLMGLVHAELDSASGYDDDDNDFLDYNEMDESITIRGSLPDDAVSTLMDDMNVMLEERLNRYIGLHVHRVRRALVNESLDCVREVLQEARLLAEAGWARKVARQEEEKYLRRKGVKERVEAAECALRDSAQRRAAVNASMATSASVGNYRGSRNVYSVAPSASSSRVVASRDEPGLSLESKRGGVKGADRLVMRRNRMYQNVEESNVSNVNARQSQREAIESMLKSIAVNESANIFKDENMEPIVIEREEKGGKRFFTTPRDESVSPASTIKASAINKSGGPRQFGAGVKTSSARLSEAMGERGKSNWSSAGNWSNVRSTSASTLVDRMDC
ncbi:hypothetical protein HDU99_004479 [Rhizoclosmatium hyalinum]|nr:hypothetical protein HDU99_004479 [Rhizoclosmatium hyalinum]